MKKRTALFVGALTVFLVVCDVHKPDPNLLYHKDKESSTVAREGRQNYPELEAASQTQNARNYDEQDKQSVLTKSQDKDINSDKSLHEDHKVRHHHGANSTQRKFKKRKGRCRRNAQRFYQPYPRMPVYVPKYNQQSYMSPNYVPPQYVVPSYYSPMCRSYCNPCVTSNCLRRCPNFPGVSTAKTTAGTKSTARITLTSTAVTKGTTKPAATITVVTKSPCDCNEDGSKSTSCDSRGACVCKPNYTGQTCSRCKDGYWKNKHKDCVQCNCNKYGSLPDTYCDNRTGKCRCKQGVTGKNCDTCKPRYYGTIEKGCKECDPCNKVGHICDPQNGKCVCPNLTDGENCQHCVEHAWGYDPGLGCKACQCSPNGSVNLQCEAVRGMCTCNIGYQGEKCNKCSFGYYGYPDCKQCNCNILGTVEENCRGDNCECTDHGRCRCKENVQGMKCDACKPRTFGLATKSPEGCTSCFCFGRSDKCVNVNWNWDKIRIWKTHNETQIIGTDYWKLPNKFMGDLTTSYGGYLTVAIKKGHFRVILEGNGVRLESSGYTERQLVETNWKIIASKNPQFSRNCHTDLTRSCFMVILQNVTSLLVEANDRIGEVLLDRANLNIPTYSPSHSVESCDCPKEYNGLSCQDPNVGYFRYFSNSPKDNWIDTVVGKAKRCECNGKSQLCDPNTGFCKNCTQNTTGNHCELCDVGHYKDNKGNCSVCLCPSQDDNHAESCSPIKDSFICNCKKGYKGQFCDRCDEGYFDKAPDTNSLICEPCNCNSFGVVNVGIGICNKFGICQCKEGFKGGKCDECINEREYMKNGICAPCDECAALLFSEIDNLAKAVEDTYNLFKVGLNPPWQVVATTMDRHHMLSEKFKKKKTQTEDLLKDAKLDQFEKKINKMQKKLKTENDIANTNIIKTDKLQNSSSALVDEVKKLSNKLINTIETLESFEAKPVSLKSALKKAKGILHQIEKISKKFKAQEDREALSFCKNVTQKISDIYNPPSNIPKQLLDDLKNKLDDLINITAFVENIINKAERKNSENAERIAKFKEEIEKVDNNKDVESSVKDIMSKINATDDLVAQLQVVYDDLKNITDFIEIKKLEHRIRRQMEEKPKIDELFSKAVDHVQELENKINTYQSMFNFTKEEWKKINASGAYEELLNGIKEAKENVDLSREILENATNLITPPDSDNVLDKSKLAHAYSDRLKDRINNMKDVSKSLTNIKNKLDQFKYSILENGKANNDLNQILHKMETDIISQEDRVSNLEKAIQNGTAISNDMQEINKKIQDMLTSSQADFFKKYQNYLNLISKEEIDKLKAKLTDTRKYLENLDTNSTYFDTIKNFNTENKNQNLQAIQDKIEELKNKIYYAKQAADTINVAMNISNCRMSYHLPQMEVFQSLSITYKCKTCQLFKLSNDDGELNLAVNNYNIIMKFIDKNILISGTAEDKENTISIQKLSSLIKMKVGTIEKSEVTGSPYYIIHPNDQIEIGSTNNKINKKSYVYNVILNEKRFGLWKFSKTAGNCTGETRDDTDKQPENMNTFFNGKGYLRYGKNNKLNPTKLTLGFDFSTFDENSLIYLASFDESTLNAKEDNCAYIALFLKNGYLNLIVKHSNGLSSTLELDNKYNNGKKQHAEINMEFESTGNQFYILFAKNETFEDKKNTTNVLDKKNVFKIKQASHYIGGVPPIFNKTCLSINVGGFLGFLKLRSPLTNEILSYGTTRTSKQLLEFYQARINKNGYVKLMEEKVESISFILRPTSPNGLIMNLHPYIISLNNYKLKIDGVKDDYDISLEKNEYNTVNMSVKEGSLIVNRNEKIVQFPDEINIKDSIITIGDKSNGFSGLISTIFVNNKELPFTPNTVVEFSNVEIGREPPSVISRSKQKNVKSLSTFITNSMHNTETESCADLVNYEIDRDAVKFGDKSSSYIYIKTNFWKNDYKVTFEFRTFYPNGIILMSIGNQKQQHYNLLKLTEGQLGLYFKGKKIKAPIILKGKLNDGQWHKVDITKRKRKLTIVLDGEPKKMSKIPKTVVRNEIFLGDVPLISDYLNVSELELHPFKGCIKSVIINNEHQLFKNKDIILSNTGQCFSNVEDGAYFGGDAYAIFNDNFKINKIPILSFEFRTTEQNGILVSASNYGSSPALLVELQNGAIVMSIDKGNGVVSNVTNNLGSDFVLCNNMWHNVTAMYEYSSSELTVNVDGIKKIWVQSDINSLLDESSAPVYIGGVPDNVALGVLKSRNNFKGCIRKLKIEKKLVDWSNMQELNNVLLNSCPT